MNFIQSRTKAEKLKRWDCQRRGELQSGYKKMSFCWVFSRLHEREREREKQMKWWRGMIMMMMMKKMALLYTHANVFFFITWKKKKQSFSKPFLFCLLHSSSSFSSSYGGLQVELLLLSPPCSCFLHTTLYTISPTVRAALTPTCHASPKWKENAPFQLRTSVWLCGNQIKAKKHQKGIIRTCSPHQSPVQGVHKMGSFSFHFPTS